MKKILELLSDKYFRDGMLTGAMITLILMVLIFSWLFGKWTTLNIIALICFIGLLILPLNRASKTHINK